MLKIKYSVNKETCFAWWVQVISGWGWASSKTDTEYYRSQGSQFSEEENSALEKLKLVLQKDSNSYGWIWERYDGNDFNDEGEQKIWNEIVSVFSPRFEKLWIDEYPLLENWRNELSLTNMEATNKTIKAFSDFASVSVSDQSEIEVRICMGYFPDAPEGHAKKEFPNFVIANISHTSHEYMARVLGLITHEILHKIDYQSTTLTNLLEKSYLKIIEPSGIKTLWKWKHLLTESVLHSVASKRYNSYFGRMVVSDEKKILSDTLLSVDMEKYGESHGALIRVIAGRIESMTASYLNKGKEIDEGYCNEVASSWAKLLSGK
ncbi:MAG: hypothetical protein NTZ36_03120 [Candidatus Jorgensenbacteria bacterium]|nr:hypothetical protein [Candidatus Jorgensenbacteria bacterium]